MAERDALYLFRSPVDHDTASPRPTSKGAGFLLGGFAALVGFPRFQIAQLPPGAPRRQNERFGKAQLGLRPAPRRGAVNAISSGDLRIREIGFGHAMHSNRLRLVTACPAGGETLMFKINRLIGLLI